MEDTDNRNPIRVVGPPGAHCTAIWQWVITNKIKLLFACLMIVALALAIALGVKNNQPAPSCKTGETGETGEKAPSTLCQEPSCLWIGAQRVAAANTSVSPCEDFFQFACGGHSDNNPVLAMNLRDDITTDKLHNLLLDQPKGEEDYNADWKVRRVYGSCLEGETRRQDAANTVLGHLQRLGGWWLAPGWNASSFHLQTALQYAHGTLDLPIFWQLWPRDLRGLGMIVIDPILKTRVPSSKPKQMLLENYIASVTQLYLRDMNITAGEDVDEGIKVFASDVVDMSKRLEAIGVPEMGTELSGEDDVARLNHLLPAPLDLDWSEILYAKLGIRKSRFMAPVFFHTKISRPWLTLLRSMVTEEEIRTLNSYIIWQVLEDFIVAMPLEYRNIKENYKHDVGQGEGNRRKECQDILNNLLFEATGSLYARHYLEPKSKQMVVEMAKVMKKEYIDDIAHYPWMDEKSRNNAIIKMGATDIKVELPDPFKNKQYVNLLLDKLIIAKDAPFMDNLLALKEFQRIVYGRLIRADFTEAFLARLAFSPTVEAPSYLNLIGVPVTLLELPAFGPSLPPHYNMGSLGPLLARNFLPFITAERGVWINWKDRYTVMSNGTQKKWDHMLERLSCLDNFTSYVRQKYLNQISSDITKENMTAEIVGIRLAYKAYKTWQDYHPSASKQPIPGLDLTPDQSFFVAYAQTKFWMDRKNGKTEETMFTPESVNFALSQLPEFSEAFQCGRSPMNPEDRCVLETLQPSQTRA